MLKIEVSVRGVFLILLTLLGFWILIQLWSVLLLVLISLILMVGLLPYVEAMVRRGIPRTSAVLILLFIFILVVVGMLSIMVPALISEVTSVRDNLPDSAREIEKLLAHLGINVQLQDRARNIDWDKIISGHAAINYGQRLLTISISIITVVVMTAYLLSDTPRLSRFVSQFIPPSREAEVERLFQSLTLVVGGFLRGQAITSLAIAVYTFVLLRVVGVPNALAFAVLAGFADVIPLVGALIATVPPVAAALQGSSTQALIVLVGLILYQQFEDRFLVPRVYGQTLNLPPLIVLIAVLSGAELLGVVGVLVALPLTAAGRVGLDYVLENREWLGPLAGTTTPTAEDQLFAPDVAPTQEEQIATNEKAEAEEERRERESGHGSGRMDEAFDG